MRQYLVVAHRTLGGAHLMDHLHELRVADPYCRFHIVVPRYHADDSPPDPSSTMLAARNALDDILERMASMGIGAAGEIGNTDPVTAVEDAIRMINVDHLGGIIVSTLPRNESPWWQGNVPDRLRHEFPDIPVSHVVADEVAVG